MKTVLGSTIVLTLVGLLFVFEASVLEALETFGDQYHFLKLQAGWLVLGYLALALAAFIPIKVWKRTSAIWYILSLLLLSLVFVPGIGKTFNGARRWISLADITVLQPIEFAKFGVTVFFASWMSKHQRVLPFIFLTLIPVALVMLQPDLGSTLILLAITFGLFYLSGGSLKILASATLIGVVGVSMAVFSSNYRMQRLTTFLNPELDPLGASFHIRQITLALGRGGLIGQGIGNSRQKLAYIPEASSDSVFSITAEEVGFVGSTLITSLYFIYLYGAHSIVSKHSKGSFPQLLGSGIMIWIGTQAILNLAAVVALVPLTGIPLPFFSYGGSSLVMVMFASGVLLSLKKKS